jgi:hypothetical protein
MKIRNKENVLKKKSKDGGAGSAVDLERVIDPKYVPVYVICITIIIILSQTWVSEKNRQKIETDHLE